MPSSDRRVALLILDGFGERGADHGNAIRLAKAPTIRGLLESPQRTNLRTSGEAVGLPPGQMGNSEVGHMTIGGGRVFHQMLTRIDAAIANGSFFSNAALLDAARAAKASGGKLHLLGLASDGGVHSHVSHAEALLELARREGLAGGRTVVHVVTDGRDTPPDSGRRHLARLEARARALGTGVVATVSGRYYAMDRDKRWERTRLAWDAIVHGRGQPATTADLALASAYGSKVFDEFVIPTVVEGVDGRVRDGDSVVFFNFRPDRARQLTRAFTEPKFEAFETGARPRVRFATMTAYDERFDLPHAFPQESTSNTLGEIVSRAGLRQLRVAETEKYAHVTYFLNGGEEKEFPGEERILVPSSKVATYDREPEMRAPEIAERVAEALRRKEHALVVVNFANCDMVGHTGNLAATVRAVEAVDAALARVLAASRGAYDVIVTADHGNAEEMIAEDGGPQTAHTTLPVPCVWIPRDARDGRALAEGTLADVAPTVLDLLGLPQPPQMQGRSLRRA